MKCADCGRFCSTLNDVWPVAYWNGPERSVCDDCAERLKAVR